MSSFKQMTIIGHVEFSVKLDIPSFAQLFSEQWPASINGPGYIYVSLGIEFHHT